MYSTASWNMGTSLVHGATSPGSPICSIRRENAREISVNCALGALTAPTPVLVERLLEVGSGRCRAGRGAYLCRRLQCLNESARRSRWAQAFRAPTATTPEVMERLRRLLDGSVRVESGGEMFEAQPGTLFTFEPDERRSVSSDDGARLLLFLAPWPGPGHYRGEEQTAGRAG